MSPSSIKTVGSALALPIAPDMEVLVQGEAQIALVKTMLDKAHPARLQEPVAYAFALGVILSGRGAQIIDYGQHQGSGT